MKMHLVFCFALMLYCGLSFGQVRTDAPKLPHSYWMVFGVGGNTFASDMGRLDVNAEFGNHLLFTAAIQGEFAERWYTGPVHVTQLNNYDLLAGKIFNRKRAIITTSAGLGVVRSYSFDMGGSPLTMQSSLERYTVGIPLSAQVIFTGNIVGLGVGAYANINTIKPTIGMSINMAFGQMATRPK